MKIINLFCIICLIIGCGEKSVRKIDLPETADIWVEREGKYGRMPMIIKVNNGLKSLAGHGLLQHQVGIAVQINKPLTNGLPDDEEETHLDNIEETLITELKESNLAVFAVVVTTGGLREFIFYTHNPKAIENSFNKLEQRITSHALQLNIQRDKQWMLYKQYAG